MNYKVLAAPVPTGSCFGKSVVWLFSDRLSRLDVDRLQAYHESTYREASSPCLPDDIRERCYVQSEQYSEMFSVLDFGRILQNISGFDHNILCMVCFSGVTWHACAMKHSGSGGGFDGGSEWLFYDPEDNVEYDVDSLIFNASDVHSANSLDCKSLEDRKFFVIFWKVVRSASPSLMC